MSTLNDDDGDGGGGGDGDGDGDDDGMLDAQFTAETKKDPVNKQM